MVTEISKEMASSVFRISLRCQIILCLSFCQGRSDGGDIGIYPPKSAEVNFLWGKNDIRTAIQQFYTSLPPQKKNFIPPKTNFWLRPCLLPVCLYIVSFSPFPSFFLNFSLRPLSSYSSLNATEMAILPVLFTQSQLYK